MEANTSLCFQTTNLEKLYLQLRSVARKMTFKGECTTTNFPTHAVIPVEAAPDLLFVHITHVAEDSVHQHQHSVQQIAIIIAATSIAKNATIQSRQHLRQTVNLINSCFTPRCMRLRTNMTQSDSRI